MISVAPARSSARPQLSAVAPVVTTSSTIRIRAGGMDRHDILACILCHLCALLSVA